MGAHCKPDLDEYTTNLVKSAVRRLIGHFGFSRSDCQDVEQDLVLHLLRQMGRFDPKRSGRNTFITRIVQRKIVSIIRHRCAAQRHYARVAWSLDETAPDGEGASAERGNTLDVDADRRRTSTGELPTDLAIDLARAKDTLGVELQAVWDALLDSSKSEAARRLKCSRSAVHARVAKIRAHLEEAGLADYFDVRSDRSSSARRI